VNKGIEIDQLPTDLGPVRDGDVVLAVREGRRGRATIHLPTDANVGAILEELDRMRARLAHLERGKVGVADAAQLAGLRGPDGTRASYLRYFGWSDEPVIAADLLDDSLVEVSAYYTDVGLMPARREAGHCWFAQLATAGYPDRIVVKRDDAAGWGEGQDVTSYFAQQPGRVMGYVVGVSKAKLSPDLSDHHVHLLYDEEAP